MKKFFLLFLAALMAVLCPAYQVVEISNPLPGEGFTSGTTTGGRLVAVQAFSTNETGTVSLVCVHEAPVFTNAVLVSSSVETNFVIVSSNRAVAATIPFEFRVPEILGISTNVYTGAVLTNVAYRTVYTNIPNQVVHTNSYLALDFGGWNAAHPLETLLAVSTNVVTSTTTNVWPDVAGFVSVTNQLVSGSCSNHVASLEPSGTVYLKAHEWLMFSGTATGGFLRLILE